MDKNGFEILQNPSLNKGTAFSQEERERLNIIGLLPDTVDDLELQKKRVFTQLDTKQSDIERYVYLISLLDRNETLFYSVVMSDPVRFIPILYDPTVGEACEKFDYFYRRPRGMYISIRYKGRIAEILKQWPTKNIRFICVSTGERILGLGDLGANGMGIPIGKLQLYTACASIPPDCLLPLLLDAGTNNENLLHDPLYLGYKNHRPTESEMDEFVEEFIQAASEVFPDACVHFEDWKGTDAIKYLAKYREKICCYNDDIQGTASVAYAGLVTALQIKKEKISDQRIFVFGAGSAGLGIANLIVSAMNLEGIEAKDAQKQIAFFDVNGFLDTSRTDLSPSQKVYAKEAPSTKDLLAALDFFKPTILIGVSTVGGTFTKDVVTKMCGFTEKPIIFALSNPTEKAECTAQQAYEWSDGKALFAGGVQFPKVQLNGKDFYPGQANNFYIFPAISLAIFATKPNHITDELFIEAAKALTSQISDHERTMGALFPTQKNILEVEIKTALSVINYIFEKNLANVERPVDTEKWLREMLYKPSY